MKCFINGDLALSRPPEGIQRLLSAALEMPCRYTRCKLRPWTYYCLFGLLSVSGLRSAKPVTSNFRTSISMPLC